MISNHGDVVKLVESNKESSQLLSNLHAERKKFDELLRTNPDLNFMRGGNAGRISFNVISSEYGERQNTVRFNELERAPIVDLVKRQFRRSFPLSECYNLREDTSLPGNAPDDDHHMFINRRLLDGSARAVVSLLNPAYGGTAFRVSPKGGLITCYHNLYVTCPTAIEDLWIHRNVYSPSYDHARMLREKIEIVHCELPDLDDNAKDPLDVHEHMSTCLKHQDIAFLRSTPGEAFLIPCAADISIGDTVLCIGYPRKVSTKLIKDAYCEMKSEIAPDMEEYGQLFTFGNLSVSPGPLLASNVSALACEVATTPGFSGSPVCLVKNPRMFVGIHYRARTGKNYSLSVSVKDDGFYHMYSTLVVPELRNAELCQDDIEAINEYLSIGTTELLINKSITFTKKTN